MWTQARRRLRRAWIPVVLHLWPLARLWYRVWGLGFDGGPDETIWYFAYGSNMHDEVFLERRGMRPTDWRVGRIRGFRLRFNIEGRPRGRAAPANISPEHDSEVWGVIYRITRRELVRLNASEGIPGRRYRPLGLKAEDEHGRDLAVVTYIADGEATDGSPSLRYLTLLREGANAHGLPEAWISRLDEVEHAT